MVSVLWHSLHCSCGRCIAPPSRCQPSLQRRSCRWRCTFTRPNAIVRKTPKHVLGVNLKLWPWLWRLWCCCGTVALRLCTIRTKQNTKLMLTFSTLRIKFTKRLCGCTNTNANNNKLYHLLHSAYASSSCTRPGQAFRVAGCAQMTQDSTWRCCMNNLPHLPNAAAAMLICLLWIWGNTFAAAPTSLCVPAFGSGSQTNFSPNFRIYFMTFA